MALQCRYVFQTCVQRNLPMSIEKHAQLYSLPSNKAYFLVSYLMIISIIILTL